MRIESFWAKGFRSLRDVRLEGLGAFNVFYGPNGSGKSNILEAIRVLLQLAAVVMQQNSGPTPGEIHGAQLALSGGILHSRDLCQRAPSRIVVLGARFTEIGVLMARAIEPPELSLEVTFDWSGTPTLAISMLRVGDEDFTNIQSRDVQTDAAEVERRANIREHVRSVIYFWLPARGYGLINADRSLRTETTLSSPNGEDVIAWHLSQGHLKSALLSAQIDPRHEIRRRLDALRAILAGPPLNRPPFAPVKDPHTGDVDLRELLPEPNPEGRDISLDLAGLGIAQIYLILAQAMLLGTHAIGIEEPEAHLHAPTSGRHLRQLLIRLVEEKYVDQLFIATHSNLFDLDSKRYFDVSLDKDGCTVVSPSDLARIDREHLYEPGPAKHVLQRMLEYTPAEEIVFRRADGSPVTAKEMLRLLQEDDALAVSFLQDVHGAAVRIVRVQSKKPKDAA